MLEKTDTTIFVFSLKHKALLGGFCVSSAETLQICRYTTDKSSAVSIQKRILSTDKIYPLTSAISHSSLLQTNQCCHCFISYPLRWHHLLFGFGASKFFICIGQFCDIIDWCWFPKYQCICSIHPFLDINSSTANCKKLAGFSLSQCPKQISVFHHLIYALSFSTITGMSRKK